MEELTELERLKLSLKYSISEKHKKILKSKIDKIKNRGNSSVQQSFL
ncbi:hypothetical protein [Clostridium sp. JN-1]|nr:hypothetical protein [Clostridium sp. JN-1]